MPTDGLDEITLHGMTFHTLVGVLPHEREHPQPVEIDLTAWVHSGDDVVDYRRMYAEVRDVMESAALFYLEELADSIAARILDEFVVERVRIAVRKPHAAVGGPLGYAEVAVVRERDA
jgi:dihydroneopterin aldolase